MIAAAAPVSSAPQTGLARRVLVVVAPSRLAFLLCIDRVRYGALSVRTAVATFAALFTGLTRLGHKLGTVA
jgi:hypothetical protein